MPGAAPARNVAFTTTHWSAVLAAGGSASPGTREALETLCRTYWYPLYAFLRRRGHQPTDAEDLVQGFIAHLLEHRFFQGADPDKGRFRSYLLGSLNHFVADAEERAGRLKRGAGKAVLSLDAATAERRYALEPAELSQGIQEAVKALEAFQQRQQKALEAQRKPLEQLAPRPGR